MNKEEKGNIEIEGYDPTIEKENLMRRNHELYMEARGFVEYIREDILNQQKDKITGRKIEE